MKPLSVEDGMSDEQAVRQVYHDAQCIGGLGGGTAIFSQWKGLASSTGYIGSSFKSFDCDGAWADARARLPKAQPAVPVEERTGVTLESCIQASAAGIPLARMFMSALILLGQQDGYEDSTPQQVFDFVFEKQMYGQNLPAAAPIPEERTAEMEQLPAIELVQQERRRQIEAEGWSLEHDDLHMVGQMADAASCYAKVAAMISYPGPTPLDEPSNWPWDAEWWKPSSDPIRNLVKAGALIVAEIERLQRADHIEGTAK